MTAMSPGLAVRHLLRRQIDCSLAAAYRRMTERQAAVRAMIAGSTASRKRMFSPESTALKTTMPYSAVAASIQLPGGKTAPRPRARCHSSAITRSGNNPCSTTIEIASIGARLRVQNQGSHKAG